MNNSLMKADAPGAKPKPNPYAAYDYMMTRVADWLK